MNWYSCAMHDTKSDVHLLYFHSARQALVRQRVNDGFEFAILEQMNSK